MTAADKTLLLAAAIVALAKDNHSRSWSNHAPGRMETCPAEACRAAAGLAAEPKETT